MTSHLERGDIIIGASRNRDASYHPIIYLGENSEDEISFIGGMLTHSSEHGNIILDDYHITITYDSNRPSYFVNNQLLKKSEWGPFQKVGQLTTEGISYVLSHIQQTEPQFWEEYLNN